MKRLAVLTLVFTAGFIAGAVAGDIVTTTEYSG